MDFAMLRKFARKLFKFMSYVLSCFAFTLVVYKICKSTIIFGIYLYKLTQPIAAEVRLTKHEIIAVFWLSLLLLLWLRWCQRRYEQRLYNAMYVTRFDKLVDFCGVLSAICRSLEHAHHVNYIRYLYHLNRLGREYRINYDRAQRMSRLEDYVEFSDMDEPMPRLNSRSL